MEISRKKIKNFFQNCVRNFINYAFPMFFKFSSAIFFFRNFFGNPLQIVPSTPFPEISLRIDQEIPSTLLFMFFSILFGYFIVEYCRQFLFISQLLRKNTSSMLWANALSNNIIVISFDDSFENSASNYFGNSFENSF